MSFLSWLNDVHFTLYEMILFWIVSYSVIYFHLKVMLRVYCVIPVAVLTTEENNKKLLVDVDLDYLKNKVDAQIRTQQLYANKNLNIERMAQLLELPVRQLSLLIKTAFHQNYFEFLNHYRLLAAKERLISDDWAAASVQEIYESVGFASRSTFFTAFKKQEGITPAEYRLKHRIQVQLD